MNAVLHWDGRSWRRSAAPAGSYWGVSAAASDDVWAVGTGRGLLVAHWDGTTWTRVPFLPLPAENEQPIAGGDTFLAFSYLEAVLALGPDDVWVSGDSGKTDWGIAAHWDGTSWAAHPLHAVDADLGSLAQDSTGHIWASGGLRGGGIIAEWNGKVWRVRARRYWIPDVAARGTEIWAILDVVARWNRTGWMPLEKRHPDFTLYGLAADRHGNAWAAGFYLGDKPKQRAVVYRWTACAA